MPMRRPMNITGGAAFRFPKTATSPATAGDTFYARGEDGTICYVNVRTDGLYLTHIVADEATIASKEGVSLEELRAGTALVFPAGPFGKQPSRLPVLALLAVIAGGIAWWIWG